MKIDIDHFEQLVNKIDHLEHDIHHKNSQDTFSLITAGILVFVLYNLMQDPNFKLSDYLPNFKDKNDASNNHQYMTITNIKNTDNNHHNHPKSEETKT